MNDVKTKLLGLVLSGMLLLLCVPAVAGAKGYESVGIKAASRATSQAYREYRHALAVEKGTRLYTARYGANVGRWVWLADDVGWPRSQWGQLFYVIDRESGGSQHAVNPSSGAAGLLQFLPPWYHGDWGYPAFNPYNPRANLTAGLHIYREQGWQPWSVN